MARCAVKVAVRSGLSRLFILLGAVFVGSCWLTSGVGDGEKVVYTNANKVEKRGIVYLVAYTARRARGREGRGPKRWFQSPACLTHGIDNHPLAARRCVLLLFGWLINGVSLLRARTGAVPPRFVLFQVSTPLALNIYTAVHNPISVKGRLQLCKGALAHVDTRPVLSEIDIPVVCIQSTQNNFVKPLHTDPYVSRRGGEVRSIHKASFVRLRVLVPIMYEGV